MVKDRVLFSPAHYIFDEFKGGSEPYVAFSVADKISSFYHNSIVVTGTAKLKTKKEYQVVEVWKNLKELNMSLVPAIKFLFKYSYATSKILKKEKDITIVHHLRPFLLGSTFNILILLGFLKGKKIIIGPFCSPYIIPDPPGQYKSRRLTHYISSKVYDLLSFVLKRLSIATLRSAHAVLVYDEFTKKSVVETCGIGEDKIHIVPPGKDKEKFTFEHNFSSPEINLISVGYLIKRKRFDRLIKIFSEANKKFIGLKLHIYGDGQERVELEKIVSELGLSECILFHGFVDNYMMPQVYSQADIFVSTQLEESFGQVFLEAMAAGLPIITTDTIGSRTILSNKSFAKIVEGENDIFFAEQIIEMASNRQKLKQMSIESRKAFEAEYDWNTVLIPKIIKIYESIK